MIHVGDALTILRTMPDKSVHCIVTSPPYWGLRDYGVEGQLGLERTPEDYLSRMVEVFREARRVLRSDGTAWVNMGDSYASGGKGGGGSFMAERAEAAWQKRSSLNGWRSAPPGLKHKDLVGIPWRLALALQADDWYLRADIIWHKPNPMPESVTDRPTKSHEYIFLLSKSAHYHYDAEAVREVADPENYRSNPTTREVPPGQTRQGKLDARRGEVLCNSRNARSVWTIATQPFSDWAETSRLCRVPSDALSGDTTHIVFPSCPEHAGLARQLAKDACGEHGAAALTDIARTDGRLVQELLVGSVPTAPMFFSETTRRSWDWLARECARLANDHSNGKNRTGHAPETISPCIAFAQMNGHTADRLTRLVWFALHASMPENSIALDGSDAHSLEGTLSRKSDTVSSSCCCQFYQIRTEKTSHFATFPEALAERCIRAGCPVDGTVLDPFAGAGTTLLVAAKLNRRGVGIELNPEYAAMADRRINAALPLFAEAQA